MLQPVRIQRPHVIADGCLRNAVLTHALLQYLHHVAIDLTVRDVKPQSETGDAREQI